LPGFTLFVGTGLSLAMTAAIASHLARAELVLIGLNVILLVRFLVAYGSWRVALLSRRS
jgi:hypothetical protein